MDLSLWVILKNLYLWIKLLLSLINDVHIDLLIITLVKVNIINIFIDIINIITNIIGIFNTFVSILTILKDLMKPCKTCLASQSKQMEVCSRLCFSVSKCDWL